MTSLPLASDGPASLEQLTHALDSAPFDDELHTRVRDALREARDDAGFAAHQLAVAAFAVLGDDASPARLALALYKLAAVYAMKGRAEQAKRWYRHTLVHREAADGPLAHKNPYLERIAQAFDRTLRARTATPTPMPAQP